MKPFLFIRRMRRRGQCIRAPLALLYLLLGMAAAWHNHDVRPVSELMLQSSTSIPAANHLDDGDAFCALCSWQSLHQETTSATHAAIVSMPLAEAPNLPVIAAPVPGFSLAHLARGPPSV